ncbi:MAG: hypothetical protein HRJ53_30470 [Acidobacteria bacterium Pan2503]|uniref:Uncharacterized protein n=1 Tax=Candidatus Acidiferrum panamense TaxID=2741543 RepID=A0A7V8NXK1_9BACT|nr:hypothetical protein [Candidatus Acidoferrum panamensis]
MTALAGWENFYLIVGSSAGALIGLQSVVITLIADMRIAVGREQAGKAFATPTIVHFGAALLLSAILNALWRGVAGAAIVWGLLGFSGLVYEVIVARRMQGQIAYKPEFEDWLYQFCCPSPHIRRLLDRHTRLLPMRTRPCLGLPWRHWCCSLAAFITRGTSSPITCLSNEDERVNERPR